MYPNPIITIFSYRGVIFAFRHIEDARAEYDRLLRKNSIRGLENIAHREHMTIDEVIDIFIADAESGFDSETFITEVELK